MIPFLPLRLVYFKKTFRLLRANEASSSKSHSPTTAYYNSLYMTSLFIQLYITGLFVAS